MKAGIFILIIFYCALCPAQRDSITKSSDRHYNLKLSYNSSIIYPGINTGVEFRVRSDKKPGLKIRADNKTFIRDRLISGNLCWYHHPDFHNNLYMTAEWVMRKTNPKGFISEFSLGPGFSRTFLAGTTYRMNDNGNISVIRLAGYSYALITIGGGFGYDFSLKKQLPFSTFAKMNLLSLFPYNSTVYLRPVLELGILYTPGHLFSKKLKKEPETMSIQK